MIIQTAAEYEGPPYAPQPSCSACQLGRITLGPRGRANTAFFGGTSMSGTNILIGAAVLAAGLTLFSFMRSR